MHTTQAPNGKWIIWLDGGEPVGPYDTKAEAEDDRKGMARFYKYVNKPDFMTTDARGK